MSAVREAIKAVLDRSDAVINSGAADLLDDLVGAVEAVPVQVTIRDLDMGPENVLTFEPPNLQQIEALAQAARLEGQPLHLAVDAGVLKLKAGHFSWSPPIYPEDGAYAG